jgi:hypothetical protein
LLAVIGDVAGRVLVLSGGDVVALAPDTGVVLGAAVVDVAGPTELLLLVELQPAAIATATPSAARAAIAGFFMLLPLLLPEPQKIPQTENRIQAGYLTLHVADRATLVPVLVLLVLVFVLVWSGATLLIDAGRRRRRRRDLVERLMPLQPSIADEAQDWLQRQR